MLAYVKCLIKFYVAFYFVIVYELVWKFLADVILVSESVIYRKASLFVLNSLPESLSYLTFWGHNGCCHVV